MCVQSGKVKLEVYVTPEEMILIGKLLKGRSEDVVVASADGETNPPKPPKNA